MIKYSGSSSFRSISRRALSLTGLLICLSMATSNLVGAFAAEPVSPSAVRAELSPYLTDVLGKGNGTVIATLSSIDVKTSVVDKVKSELGLAVNNDLETLPIITIENVGLDNIEKLSLIDGIVSIEPELTLVSTSVNYLEAIKATDLTYNQNPQSAPVSLDGTGRTIGIIDSGINANHLQFQNKAGNGNRIVSQACVEQDDVEVAPCSKVPNQAAQLNCSVNSGACTHGHSVASFAAGGLMSLAGEGFSAEIQGSAPNANISFFRIADSDKNGPTNISLLAGFNKFLGDKRNNSNIAPDVVNLSIGFPYKDYPSCTQFQSLNLAINSLVSSGVTVVVASGNESNKQHITSPACLESVIAVGATEFVRNPNGQIIGEQVASYSNSSPELDLVAPGTDLVGSTPDPELYLTSISGTSFASPIVAGSVALLKQAKPSLTPAQIKSLLVSNGDLVKDNKNGQSYPRINVAKAVAAINSVPSTTTTTTVVPSTTIPATTNPGTTTTPSTTIPTPSTTRPTPGSVHSAQTAVIVSSDKILSGESVEVSVELTNNGTSDISGVETKLLIEGNIFKSEKNISLKKDEIKKVVLTAELSAADLAFAGKGPKSGLTPQLINDVVVISCWDTNICVEAKQTITILNAPPTYTRDASDRSNKQTYEDTITNTGTETITNLVVKDAGLGVLKFDKTTLKPGESATTGIIDVGPGYAPGFWEITITGEVLGRQGVLTIAKLGAEDFDEIAPTSTTTTTTTTTTVAVNVGGKTVTRAGGESLPFTGSSSGQLLFAGIWILLAGVMLLCFKEGLAKKALIKVSVRS